MNQSHTSGTGVATARKLSTDFVHNYVDRRRLTKAKPEPGQGLASTCVHFHQHGEARSTLDLV